MTPQATVAITRYGEPDELLFETLESVAEQQDVELEVLFLDQNAGETTAERCRALSTCQELQCIKFVANLDQDKLDANSVIAGDIRASDSLVNASITRASANLSFGCTRYPVSPCETMSAREPTSVAITGLP